MQKTEKNKSTSFNKIIRSVLIVALIMVSCFWAISEAYAKFVLKIEGNDSARPALFCIYAESADDTSVSLNYENPSGVFNFSVRNYNGEEVCETSLTYSVTVTTDVFIENLVISLTRGGVTFQQTVTQNQGKAEYKFENVGQFSALVKGEATLELLFDASAVIENSSCTAQITVKAVQT